ncbi:ubiquitin-conjugating enzyme E2 S [Leguminivora glycinivorella]|uniref:ubiquitin-conjugating enzyme E2 S n=1 Tax=Leguminivora glycinivorella TaxID=1035111 RepID=UPI00200FC284|nr:ubiquitin-conjugating enzyme E2 S [Leguminivora glycinivorella]
MWNSENVSPQRSRTALRELRRLAARPPPGIKLLLRDDDLSDITALIDGPAETPYFGGVFRVQIKLGKEFPAAPPRAYFLTRIFHPNVSREGEVCVNTLKRDWRPELGLEHALLALRCLMIAPNADSALNADAAELLRGRYEEYFARAKLLTEIHAKPAKGHETQNENTNLIGGLDEPTPASSGETEAEPSAAEAATEGPKAKRERRPRDKPAPARDKRKVLKRL